MAMRAPLFDNVAATKSRGLSTIANKDTGYDDDPAWRAFMNAPPLSRSLTEDEKKAIETWKARRVVPGT